MFDFSGSELLVIAIVALVVIGPKDLPRVLRAVGKWAAKARAVAREFQSSIDQMIRESELEDLKKEVETAKTEVEKVAATDIGHEIERSVDPKGDLQASLQPPELTDAVNHPAGTTETAAGSTGEAATLPAETGAPTEGAPTAAPAPAAPTEKKPETAQTAA
ncbi:MAG TPA: Sec-independent protein translocase protein TatB [Stellaceae bacterium]|nr:Sec-independent protein translocase protein TatB [Stellaceae bacterium]